jgi:fibronectin-binding autotransporter adhesin
LAINSGRLTVGGSSNNVSTTAASFSNTGTLAINGGDSFTAAKLTQIKGSTLSGGALVLGGNLDLTTAGISIATNSATLTLQGGTINSNGVNALRALTSNTKSLTLANNASLTTATTGNFTNSGTLSVNKGSTLTVGGTSNSYNQAAGTTTVDGILSGGATGSANFTGGSIFGCRHYHGKYLRGQRDGNGGDYQRGRQREGRACSRSPASTRSWRRAR